MSQLPKPIPKLGLYPYSYAVENIAEQMEFSGGPKTSLLLEMAKAIRKGELQVRSSETGAPFAVTPNMDNPSPYVTTDDVNRWLEVQGFTYRWTHQADQRDLQRELPPESHREQANREIDDSIQGNAGAEDPQIDAAQSNSTGLTKAAIIAIDWPGRTNLGALLSDVPSWLESARVMRGRRGRNGSALWNPAQIAICLLTEKNVPKRALMHHLKTYFPDYLSAWADGIEIGGL